MASFAFVLLFVASAVALALCIVEAIHLDYPIGLILMYISAFIFCLFLVVTYSYFALLIYWDRTTEKVPKTAILLIQADEINTLEPDVTLVITQVAINIPTPILEKKVSIVPILAKIPLAVVPVAAAVVRKLTVATGFSSSNSND